MDASQAFYGTLPIDLEDALQEQLGLRLVRSTGPVQELVIDSVAMPSPN